MSSIRAIGFGTCLSVGMDKQAGSRLTSNLAGSRSMVQESHVSVGCARAAHARRHGPRCDKFKLSN